MRKAIENLRTKSESYRHKLAFFTATAISLAIFFSWAGFKGYISLPNTSNLAEYQAGETQVAAVQAASPLDNSLSALRAAMSQFGDEYNLLKNSLFNVLVPFMSGIEVYESK